MASPAQEQPAAAPAAPPDPVIALDPEIKHGTLPNGLEYYVMPHKKPEQRAVLWLGVNAGSVLEDDDQRGLAHFVEHMAFNGTRRFPKQAIVDYLEKAGVRFGADLNAYTSFDQTVYQLQVPTDDHDVLMKGLDVLRDWAGDITFDPVEVDKERGVVLEEWRLGRGAFTRINDKQWPILFQGSRYAERLPIGLPETIKGAPRDRLVRFYKDWYRPHNMIVIAVGDFDPAAIEKEIAARFGDLVEPAHPRQRTPIPVPHDHEMAVTIASDRELPITRVAVYDKLDTRPNATRRDFRRFIVEDLYHQMLNARFGELAQDPAAPYLGAGSSTSTLTRTCDGFIRSAVAKTGRVTDAMALLFHEISRVEKYGFLPTELERARSRVLASYETAAREWDKTDASSMADEILRYAMHGEEMAGRPWELETIRELLPGVTLDELNHLAQTWGGARGRVIAISGPADAKLPTEAEIRAVIAGAHSASVEPWQDSDAAGPARPLIEHPPAPGKVVSTTHDAAADATLWTLANGIRVIVKPTTFSNDQVAISGWKLGGTSLIPDKQYSEARFAAQIVNEAGAGELDNIALQKVLAGKIAGINVAITERSEDVFGFARPADLETALQLVYLRLTAPRRDEAAFSVWRQAARDRVAHRLAQPEQVFADAMQVITSSDHLRRRPETVEMIDHIDQDRALAIYRSRFADLGDFTFVIVGNLDLAALQPLVETYLGSLPTAHHKDHWKDIGIRYPAGRITRTVTAGSEAKSHVELEIGASNKWTLDGERDAQILSMVLQIRLREVLREDMSGVYGVRVAAYITREPVQRRHLNISFGCDPANIDALRTAALSEIRTIVTSGIGDDYLHKVAEQLRRGQEVGRKTNGWWVSRLRSAYYFHDDFARATDIDATIARVTSANVKATAARFLDDKNVIVGILRPAPGAVAPADAPAPDAPPAPAKPPVSTTRPAMPQPGPPTVQPPPSL